jgi:hypothetical protein
MSKLSEKDKNRCRIHLAYTLDGVEDGDAFLLEDRMDNLRNNDEVRWIKMLLDKCDYAFNRMFLDNQATGIARVSNITGDIERTETVNTSEPLKVRQEAYKNAVMHLGTQLSVPVYRFFPARRFFEPTRRRRSLPRGPSDTCRSDKIVLLMRRGGYA